MNQSEALSLAVEMLEGVAPGRNFDDSEFYEQLRSVKATILPDSPKTFDPGSARVGARQDAAAEASPARHPWPRTVIVDGEEFYEIDRQTIEGRNLLLMESSRDGGEAPAVIVDADTHEVVIDEAYNGFQDYRDERALVR
jgi:hypothetical protein